MNKTSNFKIMIRMSALVKPLMVYMLLAVVMGVVGFLCAIYIPYFGVLIIAHLALEISFPVQTFFFILGGLALARGVLHYGEQACNHYIAFKLLAIIRDQVFKTLRRLSPARLEGKDAGDLVFLITSDIEALEVFYAHTISPILIAIITCSFVLIHLFMLHPIFFMIALLSYVSVGVLIPFYITKIGKKAGEASREEFAELSNYTLESLRGMQDILQYNIGNQRLTKMEMMGHSLSEKIADLKQKEGLNTSLTQIVITLSALLSLVVGSYYYVNNMLTFTTLLMGTVLIISSFAPVIALANLSNNLLVTMASARRVLNLLDEKEIVKDVKGQEAIHFGQLKVNQVSFGYDEDKILDHLNVDFRKGKITGILGKSGSGKSTLLKLIMRFWQVDEGEITIDDRSLENINTKDLRDVQGYVTQETILFHDTILNNLKIAKLNASQEEVEAACKQASIHDFINQLPNQYQTMVSELGDSLSGGEKQRIGVARAFLHDAQCILLDEPTSNLDSINEAIILKSLKKQQDKTIVIVSHRPSTLRIADQVIAIESGRVS